MNPNSDIDEFKRLLLDDKHARVAKTEAVRNAVLREILSRMGQSLEVKERFINPGSPVPHDLRDIMSCDAEGNATTSHCNKWSKASGSGWKNQWSADVPPGGYCSLSPLDVIPKEEFLASLDLSVLSTDERELLDSLDIL